MRITAGQWGGRPLVAPPGRDTRPTSDKVRQAVFNMLNARGLVEDAIILDAFSGTGALGLEALSQGAAFCCFFDIAALALAACRSNVRTLGAEGCSVILRRDAVRPGDKPENVPLATLVFLDPPYGQGLAPRALEALNAAQWLAPGAWAVIESAKSDQEGFIQAHVEKTYGDTKISLVQL